MEGRAAVSSRVPPTSERLGERSAGSVRLPSPSAVRHVREHGHVVAAHPARPLTEAELYAAYRGVR